MVIVNKRIVFLQNKEAREVYVEKSYEPLLFYRFQIYFLKFALFFLVAPQLGREENSTL